ncbi:hypothetical protein ACNQVK_03140 [Mycobacterium sp. 134]|uniref:hypothetical protein n=1 Tax=Mycobacterium sp. 134 TaxID=3400425 RepID=UPI003AAD3A07
MVSGLVEIVDLAARRGWTLGTTAEGGLWWTRGGDEVQATFAKASQRLIRCELIQVYYRDHHECDPRPQGVELEREIAAAGGRGEQGLSLLRHWLNEPPRNFGDPSLASRPCPVHDEEPPLAPVGEWPTFGRPEGSQDGASVGRVWIEYTEEDGGTGSARWGRTEDRHVDAILNAAEAAIGRPPDTAS